MPPTDQAACFLGHCWAGDEVGGVTRKPTQSPPTVALLVHVAEGPVARWQKNRCVDPSCQQVSCHHFDAFVDTGVKDGVESLKDRSSGRAHLPGGVDQPALQGQQGLPSEIRPGRDGCGTLWHEGILATLSPADLPAANSQVPSLPGFGLGSVLSGGRSSHSEDTS